MNLNGSRRKANRPKRAASGDDAEFLDRHRQKLQPDYPRQQPPQRLFQGRQPQSLAGMRRLRNAAPVQLLEGKRKRQASTWLNEFVKELPQSPPKPGRHTDRELSKERSPSPMQSIVGAQALGPPNADFLGLGPVPKKRRSAGHQQADGSGHSGSISLAANKPEMKTRPDSGYMTPSKHQENKAMGFAVDVCVSSPGHQAHGGNLGGPLSGNTTIEDHKVHAWQGYQIPPANSAEQAAAVETFTALRQAVQQGSPLVVVRAQHIQQLLDTLKTLQSLLGCQGISSQQPTHQLAASGMNGSHAAMSQAMAGAGQQTGLPPKSLGTLHAPSLQQRLHPATSFAPQPATQATRVPDQTMLPHSAEQSRSQSSFKRFDSQLCAPHNNSRHASRKQFGGLPSSGISVPVVQSLQAMVALQHQIQAESQRNQQRPRPASTAAEEQGPCRPTTRNARADADGGVLAAI